MLLKDVQKTEIEILDKAVAICNKYGIQYYLMYGTLLGAVRHKGFIPWDDDIDICMPREDYEKFCGCAQRELGSEYFLQTNETEANFVNNCAKIRKNDTYFKEIANDHLELNKGIFIDIFPLDYMGGNNFKNKIIVKLYCLTLQLMLKRSGYIFDYSKKVRLIDSFYHIDKEKGSKILSGQIAKCKNGNKYVSLAGDAYKNSVFDIKDFGEGVMLQFGENTYNCPMNFDKLLTQIYGDYMTLPEEKDRITHSDLE